MKNMLLVVFLLFVFNPLSGQSGEGTSNRFFRIGAFKEVHNPAWGVTDDPWCINDHTVIFDKKTHRWHVIGITHSRKMDYMKDPGLNLLHISADTLFQRPWQVHPHVLTAMPAYKESLLWAPHCLFHKGNYYLFASAGGQEGAHRHEAYQINLYLSSDLFHWERFDGNPLFTDGFDARDPMVLKNDREWIIYYTANTTPEGGNHIIAARTSKDLIHWGDRKTVFVHSRQGTFGGPTESPFVVKHGNWFYFFLCDGGHTDVYRTRDPFYFTMDDLVAEIDQCRAAEIILDDQGNYYITSAGWFGGDYGLKIAPLVWLDGSADSPIALPVTKKPRNYYVNSAEGNDEWNGTKERPWKSLTKASSAPLQRGDTLFFARGSSFTGGIEISASGESDHPIVLPAYGEGSMPAFSNPDTTILTGNAIRLSGNHIVVDGLYFHDCAAAAANAPYVGVWDVGAVRIMRGANYCTVKNCEFSNCPKAIQSTGEYALITGNYLHSAHSRPLSYPDWGPIGIHIGNSHQEVSYNVIRDYYYIGGSFGADGGAIEIDDGRNPKRDIFIHHNYTSSNMGFLEVSWFADIAKTETHDLRITHNLSDDFQDFVMLWAPVHNTVIEENTIIRTRQVKNDIVPAVFICDYGGAIIRRNLIITDSLTQVYTGKKEYYRTNEHTHNVYLSADGSRPNIGTELHPTEQVSNYGNYRGEMKIPNSW